MIPFFGKVAFTAGTTPYLWDDVLLAAWQRGDWAALEVQVREGLACVRRLEDEMPDALTNAELEEAASEFRYARDLIAADEIEAWLAERGLGVDGWLDFIRRALLRERWAEELPEFLGRYPAQSDVVEATIVTEAVCSGALTEFAEALAARAAVYDRARTGPASGSGDGPRTRDRADLDHVSTPGSDARVAGEDGPAPLPPRLLLGRSPEECRRQLARLARLEETFQAFRAAILTPEAVAREVECHRLEWIRLDLQAVAFPTSEAAQEAVLCVREDGTPLDEVAAAAHLSCQRDRLYLDQVEPELRDALRAAAKGDLVGPVAIGAECRLLFILDKTLPLLDDADTRARAETAVEASAVENEVGERVRWGHRP